MLTDERTIRIQERLKNTIPIETPGAWYHEDVPMLLRAIDIAKKTCPNGGNDGHITPRPCQCESEALAIQSIKYGKWAVNEFGHYCTSCEEYIHEPDDGCMVTYAYCPHCGADMR